MIMPFIRLVVIYVVVIAAVVGFFQRDRIIAATGMSMAWLHPSDNTEPAPQSSAAQPVAVPEPAAQSAETDPNSDTKPDPNQAQFAVSDPSDEDQPQKPQTTQAPLVQPLADQPPAAQDDTATRLTEARRAYWSGDLTRAEALYAALANDAPDNPDVNGELGNVLYAQRRYGAAAEAYLVTGKLLVTSGNRAQAMPLVAVLQSIAPDKAAVLRALMTN